MQCFIQNARYFVHLFMPLTMHNHPRVIISPLSSDSELRFEWWKHCRIESDWECSWCSLESWSIHWVWLGRPAIPRSICERLATMLSICWSLLRIFKKCSKQKKQMVRKQRKSFLFFIRFTIWVCSLELHSARHTAVDDLQVLAFSSNEEFYHHWARWSTW